jgi:hypothetical protein
MAIPVSPNTPFIDPNANLVNVFELYGYNQRFVESLIAKQNPQFQRSVITKLASELGAPKIITATNRVFEIPRQPNDYPSATIASRAVSGSNLVLTFTDGTFQAIREGNGIKAKNGTVAKVISKAPGTITIQFFASPSGASAFATADFAANEAAIDFGDLGNPNNRISKETLFTLPIRYTNIVGCINETVEVTAEEASQLTYLDSVDGNKFYALNKQKQAAERMLQYETERMWSDLPKVLDRDNPFGSTLINQIKTMGGVTRGITSSAGITENEFHETAEMFINNGGMSGNEVVIVCGYSYLADLQRNVFKAFVTTAGTTNVIGGQTVKGINAMEYAYDGFTYKIIVDPVLNNPRMFGTSSLFPGKTIGSKSAMWLSPEPVATENGGTLPFLQDYYYISGDIMSTEIDGMTDIKGNPVKKGSNGKLAASIEMSLNKTSQLMNPSGGLYHYPTA